VVFNRVKLWHARVPLAGTTGAASNKTAHNYIGVRIGGEGMEPQLKQIEDCLQLWVKVW